MKIRQPFEPFELCSTPAGNKTKKNYIEDAEGCLHLNGETDIDEEICSHAGECKLDLLVERIKNGDPTVQREPNYIDLTNVPQNVREMREAMLTLEYNFDALPDEVRDAFDHDVNKYIRTAGTQEWSQKMAKAAPKPAMENPAPAPAEERKAE